MGPEQEAELQLVLRAKDGDERAVSQLINNYMPLIKSIAKGMFVPGASYDDAIQEGRIAVFKAVQYFKGETGFPQFTAMVVRRKMYDLLRNHTRNKHVVLNEASRLESPLYGDAAMETTRTLYDILPDDGPEPHDTLEDKEVAIKLRAALMRSVRTELDAKVLQKYMRGYSYAQIAFTIGRTEKSVDNTLQRIRKNLKSEWLRVMAEHAQ
jgi:RNA polymerase sporulation-specific sigma factor